MPEPAANHAKNKEFRLHLASALYFLSRVAVAGFVFAVPAAYFIRGHVEMPVVLGGAGLVALLFISYYLAAAGLRCVACSNPVLMDNGVRKHQHARRLPGLSHRARVAWDILFRTNFQCMYCHTRCRCKKTWASGSPAAAQTARPVPEAAGGANEFPESVFSSVFGDVDPGPHASKSSVGRFPETEPEDSEDMGMETAPDRVVERVVKPSFKPASIFPEARTVPVALAPEPDAGGAAKNIASEPERDPEESESPKEAPVQKETARETPAKTERTPLPWEMPAPRRQTAPATEPKSKIPTAPVAPAKPETAKTTNETPAMNDHTPERSAAPVPSNPFLAAAAAQPPPPGPMLPGRPRPQQPSAETTAAPSFPPAPAAAPSDGPPPWTLPSAPRAAAPPQGITAPVLPVIPETAATIARRPQMGTSPVPQLPPSAFGGMPAATAPVAPQPFAPPASSLPPSLLRDVVGVLEEGQRSISSAFQSIIEKLEARLNATAAAPAPAAPVPVAAPQVSPVVPPPAEPAPRMVAPLPPLVSAPPTPILPPAPRLPVEPVAEMPAVPPAARQPKPEPEPEPEPETPAPARRRFARPSGAAAQSLHETLNGAFAPEPPASAPAPYTNGHHAHSAPIESPFAFAPQPAAVPAARQAAFAPPSVHSPFAVAEETLTAATSPHNPQPAPFTFLKPQGDHFAPKSTTAPVPAAAPAPAAPAISAYDALEDTPLPWMQPVGGRR